MASNWETDAGAWREYNWGGNITKSESLVLIDNFEDQRAIIWL